MTFAKKRALESLEHRELAAIVFIRDYIQFLFDGPILNLYVWPTVITARQMFSFGNAAYRDALCSQIGKTVSRVSEDPGVSLGIELADHTTIKISLQDEDRRAVEAVALQVDHDTGWNTW